MVCRSDVVEQGGPADERTAHGLPHDLLGVRPDVLVLAAGLLDEVDGGLELGEEDRQDAGLVEPLESGVDVPAEQELLHGGAEARLVGVGEAGGVLLAELGDGVRRPAAFVHGDRAGDLDEDDRIGLDEGAQTAGQGLRGHGPR
jgi:hypothetical protein